MIVNEITIKGEFIKLDQLLKFADVAQSGGMAKEMIADEIVSVDGEICTMRGTKIRPGTEVMVEFEDETVLIKVS